MYTEVGKFLRHLRIEKGETLREMAINLDYSSAFLSAIETGKKRAPNDFFDKISELYVLTKEKKEELTNAIDNSLESIKIDFENATPEKQRVGVLFARSFDKIDEDTLKDIENLIKKRGD